MVFQGAWALLREQQALPVFRVLAFLMGAQCPSPELCSSRREQEHYAEGLLGNVRN